MFIKSIGGFSKQNFLFNIMQLRHLQILTSIAQDRNVKILYPFPVEMMRAFENSDQKKSPKPIPQSPEASVKNQNSPNSIENCMILFSILKKKLLFNYS